MSCKLCEKNQAPQGVPQVLEIINKEKPVLFHKVTFPASIGDDETNPPDTLDYKNVLLQYEANKHAYLYSSDGAATQLPTGETDLKAIKETLAEHGVQIEELQQTTEEIQANVTTNTADITNLQNMMEEVKSGLDTTNEKVANNTTSISNLTAAVDSQGNQITENANNITTVTDNLEGLTTVVNGLSDDMDTAQGDITKAQSDIAANTTNIDANTSAIDAINNNLNVYVEKETEFNGNNSTLDVVHTKINLKTSATEETTDALPVASETQAGIMNSSTFSAVQRNSENVDTILNGAVALTGLPETPTQEELTEQWKTATGKTELINRADIYDVTNEKRWTYYENTNTWYSASTNGGTIEINQATNDSLGIVMGSTDPGQIFIEPNGRMSVNNWDEHQQDITNLQNLTSEQGALLNTTAAQLEETQKDANDALADISAIQADYVSKTNIKSINGESLLGTGNITVMSSIPVLASRYYTSTDAIMVRRDIADTLANELPIGSIIAMVVLGDTTTFTTLPAIDNTQYPIRLMGASYLTASSPSTSLIAYPNTVYVLEFDGEYWNVLNTNKQVATTDIASSAVTSTKLASGAVTESKIASSAIMTPEEFKAAWEAA